MFVFSCRWMAGAVAEVSTLGRYYRHFRRNLLSVAFPACVAWAILADYGHTVRFRKAKALEKAKEDLQ